MTQSLAQRVAEAADLVTVALDELLPRADGPESQLTEAMRYAALGPGKRLRTFFALETGRMFDVPERSVLRAASSIASKASRARASNASPASLAETCRVVRTRSLTPRRRSNAAIERETEGWERPNSRAALEKLPLSTVRTNNASCCRRSFIPVTNISYHF